jgi:hypothetical protein
MKTERYEIRWAAALAVLALTIFGLVGFGTPRTIAARTIVHASSPIGLVAGQRASLQWTNLSNRQVGYEMFFLDADGSVRKVSRGLLLPARSIALELGYSELGSRELRAHTRAVLRIIGATANALPALEVFDEATSKTSYGLLLPAVEFDPQPDPPGQH